MFENPHIIYNLAKHKHEELLAECERIRLVNCALKMHKKNMGCFGKIIVFIADILIKIGIGIKRRWIPMGDEAGDTFTVSQENK